MRLIGKFDDEELARTFSKHLSQLKIDNQIAIEPDGTFELWVIWEDEVKRAEQLLSQFQVPHDETTPRDVPKEIQELHEHKEEKKEKKQAQKTYTSTERLIGNLTLFLIIISVMVGLFSGLGHNITFLQKFFITDIIGDGGFIQWHRGLPEVTAGEFWRLITPIFVHFGFAHLLFNMLWLYTLGNMVEVRQGSWFLGIFIAIVAIVSNLAQYLVSSPYFGGMSGVVYGLLGYCWMKGKYDPGSKIYLHRVTIYMMIVWYFLCLTGLLGRMANAAHTAGLVIGVLWGYLASISRTEPAKKTAG
ncbi:MAG: rhomboid protease GlpG [Acidobacteriota bacterium]|nr:rhomboid protease GlpG [Acidobacteriota bacterium]